MDNIYNEGLIPVPTFAEIHNLSRNAIHVSHKNGCEFVVKRGKNAYVDTTKLYKRKEFRQKIWLAAHDNYYAMMEYFGSENKFALWLAKYSDVPHGSWVDFLTKYLFMLPSDAPFSYKVPNRMWFFFRATRMVLRYRDRREQRIYERLPNRDMYEEIYKERGCKR